MEIGLFTKSLYDIGGGQHEIVNNDVGIIIIYKIMSRVQGEYQYV